MRLVVIVLVSLALVVPVLLAASYSADIVSTGSYGSEYRFTWNQGCSGYSLGPNACRTNFQPMWCPLSSTGSTPLTENCGVCDCAHGSGTYCDENDPIECQACGLDCDDVCQPGWSSCSFDYADGCNVINVVCNYDPDLIGYGTRNHCSHKDGRHVHGIPIGGGQYEDCVVDTRVCNDREMRVLSSDYLGTIFDLCPDGYTDEYGVFKTPPGTGTAGVTWLVYSSYDRCRRDTDCWPDDDPDDPDDPDVECSSDSECPASEPRRVCVGNDGYREECRSGICTAENECDWDDWEACSATRSCGTCEPLGNPSWCTNGECRC